MVYCHDLLVCSSSHYFSSMLDFQRKDSYLSDFMKKMFKTGLHSDAYNPIFFSNLA